MAMKRRLELTSNRAAKEPGRWGAIGETVTIVVTVAIACVLASLLLSLLSR